MKNVAIRLDDAKYRRLRAIVVRRGTTLQAAVESLIDQYLTGSRDAAGAGAEKSFRGFLRHSDVIKDRLRECHRDLKRARKRT